MAFPSEQPRLQADSGYRRCSLGVLHSTVGCRTVAAARALLRSDVFGYRGGQYSFMMTPAMRAGLSDNALTSFCNAPTRDSFLRATTRAAPQRAAITWASAP